MTNNEWSHIFAVCLRGLGREYVNTQNIKRRQAEGLGAQFAALCIRNFMRTYWGGLASKLLSKRGLYTELNDVERLIVYY